MLDACGVSSPEELFAHLPEAVRLGRPLALAPGISEYEIVQYFRDRAAENGNGYACFLGAGVYNHYQPVLVDTVVSRGEFLTSYTPYQAEIAQGTLTAIFEFQTMICQLTGMDVANASMYDGCSTVPEAAMMAARATGKGRVLVSGTVHPEYREVLATYARNQGMPVAEFGYVAGSGNLDLEDLERQMDSLTCAVIIQTPNFFGIVEQVTAAAEIAHRHGALLVVVFTAERFGEDPDMPGVPFYAFGSLFPRVTRYAFVMLATMLLEGELRRHNTLHTTPHQLPREPIAEQDSARERVKTDRRDAEHLVRLLLASKLQPV